MRSKWYYDSSEFGGIWDDITDAVSSVFDKVPDFYKQAESWLDEGIEYAKSKIIEAKDQMASLLELQDDVDKAIRNIPENEASRAIKQELIKRRDESRGFFEEYVIPAWTQFANAIGISANPDKSKEDFTFGAIPLAIGLIGAAAIAAAAAVIYWSKRNYDFEEKILQDAEIAKVRYSEKSATGNLVELSKNMKWPILFGSVALLGIVGLRFLKK